MKICLLLCLVLPHVIVGSIFQQQRNVDLDTIDNYDYYKPSQAQYTIDAQQAVNPDIAAQIQQYNGQLDFNSPQTIQELKDLHNPRNKNLNYEQLDAKNQETVRKLIAHRLQKQQQKQRFFVNQERSQEYQQDEPQHADKSQEQYYSQEKDSQQYRNKRNQEKHQYSQEQSNSQEYTKYQKYQNKHSSSEESASQEQTRTQKYYVPSPESGSQEQLRFQKNYYGNKQEVKRQQKGQVKKQQNKQHNIYQKYADVQDNVVNQYQTKEQQRGYYNQQYYVPTLRNNQILKQSTKRVAIPEYGDSITWRGLSMNAGPYSPVDEQSDIAKIYSDALNTIPHMTEEQKMEYHHAIDKAVKTENEDAHLNATELLKKNNYIVEEHTVKTDDGYILTLFRILPRQMSRDIQKRPVVFLMHGLLGSADDWLLMGPGKSLAYMLVDADYEVWLGNARGSKYSRNHVSKNAALPDFWQFSIDEIALHDLPAMIDYALETARQEKLYYVGYSQGTTAFFALMSTYPAYNEKIITMYALSPMAYMSHVRSPLVKMIAPNSVFAEHLEQVLPAGRFRLTPEVLSTVGGAMLAKQIGCKNVSSNLNFVMSGFDVDQMEVERIPVIMRHLPAGASTRQMKHFGQSVAYGDFRMYDFGPEMNRKVYGSRLSPKYELSNVKTPVSLYYSEADWLAHPEDVQRLKSELPTVSEAYQVPEPHFGNMAFQFGKSAPELVYKRIISSIQKNTTY